MKPSFILMITLSGLLAGAARAQETNIQLNVESVPAVKPQPQRAPMMIATGTPAPAPVATAEADAAKQPGVVNKPAAAGSPATTAPAAAATPAAPSPIVLPGAQPAAQSVDPGFQGTGNPKYDELIKQSAARNGIDPNLIVALMRQESGFNSRARSYKGAMGLMQLMPATARRFGVTNFYDPAQNIEGGARYLRFLMDTFNGDTKLVLAGYNAGENAVINYGYQVPPYRETKNYVRAITARYDKKKTASLPARAIATSEGPVAPAPAAFAGGSSNRLSNNY
jgi:soluble lytic murein transglycosylase-like protein